MMRQWVTRFLLKNTATMNRTTKKPCLGTLPCDRVHLVLRTTDMSMNAFRLAHSSEPLNLCSRALLPKRARQFLRANLSGSSYIPFRRTRPGLEMEVTMTKQSGQMTLTTVTVRMLTAKVPNSSLVASFECRRRRVRSGVDEGTGLMVGCPLVQAATTAIIGLTGRFLL